MADVSLLSNQASSLIATLDQTASTRNPFEYAYPKDLSNSNIPSHSVSYQVIQPNSTKAFNSANDFLIPKQGFLTKLYLKLQITNTSGGNVYHSETLAPLLVNEVQLLTQGRQIAKMDTSSLLAYLSDQPYQSKKSIEKALSLASDTVTLANNGVFTAYLPILFYQFDNINAALHTDFLENLVVRCNIGAASQFFSDAEDAGSAVTSGLNLTTLELIGEYRRVPSKAENSIVQYNYASGNLVMVTNDPVTESVTKTLGGTTSEKMEITLNTNRCVQKIFVAVNKEDNTNVGTYIDSRARFLKLKNIEFSAGGQTILPKTIDADMLQLLNQHTIDERGVSYSNHWDTDLKAAATNWYSVGAIGISKDSERNSGALSFRELTNAKISVELDTSATGTNTGSGNYVMYVVMQCAGLLSISSASGRITSALNS